MSRALPFLAALLLASCVNGAGGGPAEVKYDRDVCTACSMVISDPAFAAQVKGPNGEPKKFDDLGCALSWLEQQSFRDDHTVLIWVTDGHGGWADARAGRFVAGKATPMGYGFAPAAAGSLDFEAVRAQLRAAANAHQKKETP